MLQNQDSEGASGFHSNQEATCSLSFSELMGEQQRYSRSKFKKKRATNVLAS